MKSTDGGCTFSAVYSTFDGYTVSGGGNLIPEVTTPSRILKLVSSIDGKRTYALMESGAIQNQGDPASSSYVLVSENGAAWRRSNSPVLGSPVSLSLVGISGEVSLLAVRSASNQQKLAVYLSTDRANWIPQTRPGNEVMAEDAILDPTDPASVWAWGSAGLMHSTNAGQTFSAVSDIHGPVSRVEVTPFAPSTVFAFAAGGGGYESRDRSRWSTFPAPSGVTSATLGPLDSHLAIVANGRGALLRVGGGALIFTPTVTNSVSQALASVGPRGPIDWKLHLSDGTSILRRGLKPEPPPQLVGPAVVHDKTVLSSTVELQPASVVVQLRPGESRKVPYVLNLPAHPSPLDVMFLLDSTGSMTPTINGLRKGIASIVDQLAKSGVDVNFGLGDFKDYPLAPYGFPGDYPYQRGLAISPPGKALADAINRLSAGGGGDSPESDLAALYYSTTGESQPIVSGKGIGGYYVPPNQGAGYRKDAVRVAILATDESFNYGVGYPGPSWDKTIAALNAAKVKVVGLDVSGTNWPRADLSRVAEATHAVAPRQGVDCNDDHVTDIGEGKPLVCPVAASGASLNLGPAILALLASLHDDAPVEFAVAGAKGNAKVSGPKVFNAINLKAEHRLSTAVTFTCPKSGESTNLMSLGAFIRNQAVATAHARLVCSSPPPPNVQVPPVVAPAIPPAIAAVVAVAPPAQPPPANPNPQPNANPQFNPQLGAAAESQDQAELVVATIELPADEQPTELAMSRRDDTFGGLWALELLALGMAGMGASWVVRRRHQQAVAVRSVRAD